MGFSNEKIVFTGTLQSMTRKQAQALVFALNGETQSSVNQTTTILVVGQSAIRLFDEDPRSKKRKQCETLIAQGYPIRLMDEQMFLKEVLVHFQQLIHLY